MSSFCRFFLAILAAATYQNLNAAVLPSSTGSNGSSLIAFGSIDPHWVYTSVPKQDCPIVTPVCVAGSSTNVTGTFNAYAVDTTGSNTVGFWSPADPPSDGLSHWLSPVLSHSTDAGNVLAPSSSSSTDYCQPSDPAGFCLWVAQTSFNLTGINANTFKLNVQAESDDAFQLFLNGILELTCSGNCLGAWTGPITISSGFNSGVNTLSLNVFDDTNQSPTGFRVELSYSYAPGTPEPASFVLLGAGLAAGLVYRKTRKVAGL